jgi:hypothetical protein
VIGRVDTATGDEEDATDFELKELSLADEERVERDVSIVVGEEEVERSKSRVS